MKHLFLKTIILVVLFFIAKPVFGAVVINEALYDPTGTDTGLEYIILYNNGAESSFLNNYCLYAAGKHYIINSLTINSQSSVVIHWNTNGTNTSTDIYTGSALENMSNTSDVISLSNATTHSPSTIVDYIRYGSTVKTWQSDAVSAGIWTTDTSIPKISVSGKAIKLKTDGVDNNSPNDWIEATPTIAQSSSAPTGDDSTEDIPEQTSSSSTSTKDSKPTADAGDNVIGFVNQEIKFDGSKSSDPDTVDLHYEWNMGNGKLLEEPSPSYIYAFPGTYLVTLTVFDGKSYASDTITVEIQQAQITINEFLPNPNGADETGEWIEIYNSSEFITDISGWGLSDSASSSKPFTFPENTLIAPKSYLVFSRPITKITLNNDQDSVKLLMPGGILFQEIKYEKPPQGKSSARTEEGFVWSDPTPGMANISGTIGNDPSTGSGQAKQTTSQLDIVEPQITKNSTKTYSINLTDNKIEGGYVTISPNNFTSAPSNGASVDKPASPAGRQTSITNANELASIEQGAQKPINLVFIIIAIVFGMGFIGIILVKFKRKTQ